MLPYYNPKNPWATEDGGCSIFACRCEGILKAKVLREKVYSLENIRTPGPWMNISFHMISKKKWRE